MLNQHHPVLKNIDSCIKPLVKRVLQEKELGINCEEIELCSVTSSCGRSKGDRFKLFIPYAGQKLIWHVLFDSEHYEMGPDFIFNDESFMSNPNIEFLPEMVPSLATWNPLDSDALAKVIEELLKCYKQHQIQLCAQQGERLQLEYNTLVHDIEISNKDIEIILLPMGGKPLEAHFLIRLSLDFSHLLEQNNQLENSSAMLSVTFHGPDWNRIVPQLRLSKNLETILGGTGNFHIPFFPSDKYLMDYVPEVKRHIEEKITVALKCYKLRKGFVSALIALQRGNIIEYDAEEFKQIAVLLVHKDFHFIMHCNLPNTFPEDKPTVILQSIYHMTMQGKLYDEVLDDAPYCPRWKPVKMVIKLLTFITEVVDTRFKMHSVKHSHF